MLAKETIMERQYTAVFECKNWATKIPQSVVHSLRSVVDDIGANAGYIISKQGFQSGAYEVASNTNIKLLSWQEFQELFAEQWYWACFTKLVFHCLNTTSFCSPNPWFPEWTDYLTDAERLEFKEFWILNEPLRTLVGDLDGVGGRKRVHLPLSYIDRYKDAPSDLQLISTYREFYLALETIVGEVRQEHQRFQSLATARMPPASDNPRKETGSEMLEGILSRVRRAP